MSHSSTASSAKSKHDRSTSNSTSSNPKASTNLFGNMYTQEEIRQLKMKHNAKPYNVQEQAKRILQDEAKYQELRKKLVDENVFTHVAAHEVLNRILFEWRKEEENEEETVENEGGVGLLRRLGEGVKTRINKVSTRSSSRSCTGSSIFSSDD